MMNTFKLIMGIIIRSVLLLIPGVVFGWWVWYKAPVMVSVLSAIGVEFIYLTIIALILIFIRAAKDVQKKKEVNH